MRLTDVEFREDAKYRKKYEKHEEVRKKLEIAKGCMNFKGFVCKKTNCELYLCPLNIHFRVEKFGVDKP